MRPLLSFEDTRVDRRLAVGLDAIGESFVVDRDDLFQLRAEVMERGGIEVVIPAGKPLATSSW